MDYSSEEIYRMESWGLWFMKYPFCLFKWDDKTWADFGCRNLNRGRVLGA